MRGSKHLGQAMLIIAVMAVGLHAAGTSAFAAEAGQDWRPIYDIVLKWVNLAILVFLIVKFLKKPLMDFLRGQKEDLAAEIGALEDKKEAFERNLEETQRKVEEGDAHIQKIKENILDQGKREKNKIIEDAKTQSALMIEESKRKVDFQIYQAREKFRSELVDAAVNLATQKLPQMITEDDHEKFIQKYLAAASRS